MLPILAVLLVIAQCAIAGPTVNVNAYPVNQVPVPRDNGRFISSFLTDGTLAYVDAASLPFYIQMLLANMNDMADSNNVAAQAAAVLDAIVVMGEVASGIPGDACEAAALVNAYAYSVSSGNTSGVRQALPAFIGRVYTYIDLITQLIINPNSVKFAVGPRGSCLGGGRTYQFEEAWGGIVNNSNPVLKSYLVEVYCDSRRMYNAIGVTNNNVAAHVTAAAIPVVNEITQSALEGLVPFVRAVASGSANLVQAAANAKSSLAVATSSARV